MPALDAAGREKLGAIVAEAYDRWAGGPVPAEFNACPHCVDERVPQLLRVTPVREIGPNLLAQYYQAAHTSEWYGAAHSRELHHEIKRFLPRHLELVSAYRPCGIDYEFALSGVDPRDPAWSDADRELLCRWAAAFYAVCLSEYEMDDSALPVQHLDEGWYSDPLAPTCDDVLAMFERRHFDLAPLLELWMRATSLSSLLHFVDVLLGVGQDSRATGCVARWFHQPDVRAHFGKRCLDAAASPDVTAGGGLRDADWERVEFAFDILTSRVS